LPGDEEADPLHVTEIIVAPTPPAPTMTRQTSILTFVTQNSSEVIVPTGSISLPTTTNLTTQPKHGVKKRHRGYPYCDTFGCKYCRTINKTGTLQSNTTGIIHPTMRKVSCRSSNLIYAVTCKKCGIQYVGQTLLRIKDRFVGHFGDINKSNQEKPLGKHFSQHTHNGIEDVIITVLEFIKMPPKSPQAITIRHRVE